MRHDMVVLMDDFLAYNAFDEGHAERPGKGKGQPGTEGQADCGIKGPPKYSIDVAADKTGDFSGDRRDEDLQNLNPDENDNRKRTETVEECDDFCTIGKEAVQIKVVKKENARRNQQDQDGQFEDIFFVH